MFLDPYHRRQLLGLTISKVVSRIKKAASTAQRKRSISEGLEALIQEKVSHPNLVFSLKKGFGTGLVRRFSNIADPHLSILTNSELPFESFQIWMNRLARK